MIELNERSNIKRKYMNFLARSHSVIFTFCCCKACCQRCQAFLSPQWPCWCNLPQIPCDHLWDLGFQKPSNFDVSCTTRYRQFYVQVSISNVQALIHAVLIQLFFYLSHLFFWISWSILSFVTLFSKSFLMPSVNSRKLAISPILDLERVRVSYLYLYFWFMLS